MVSLMKFTQHLMKKKKSFSQSHLENSRLDTYDSFFEASTTLIEKLDKKHYEKIMNQYTLGT